MLSQTVIFLFILGFGGLITGLRALNIDLLGCVGLGILNQVLKVVYGIAGAIALYYFVMNYDVIKASNTPLELAVMITLIATNVCIGLSGLGVTIYLGMLQKPLQLIAGAAGVYALFAAFKLLSL